MRASVYVFMSVNGIRVCTPSSSGCVRRKKAHVSLNELSSAPPVFMENQRKKKKLEFQTGVKMFGRGADDQRWKEGVSAQGSSAQAAAGSSVQQGTHSQVVTSYWKCPWALTFENKSKREGSMQVVPTRRARERATDLLLRCRTQAG